MPGGSLPGNSHFPENTANVSKISWFRPPPPRPGGKWVIIKLKKELKDACEQPQGERQTQALQ